MNKESFIKEIKEKISNIYTDDYEIAVQKISKNNGLVLNGLQIIKKDINIAPVIYLDGFYENYKNGYTVEDAIQTIIDIYEEAKMENNFSSDSITDFDQIKDRICFKLINAEKNQELLKEVPYVPFMDLAVVFYILLEKNFSNGNATILVKNTFMQFWNNPDINDIYEIAKSNTQRLLKGNVSPIKETLESMLSSHDDLEDILSECDFVPMFIVSNETKINGASAILYDGFLKRFSKIMNGDFYILPSSIHETILIPESAGMDEEYLSEMVRSVNEQAVVLEEVLSDNAYKYIADEDRIEML